MLRILLADDHHIVRRGIRHLIEQGQAATVCAEAANGPEAIALAAATEPDMAILDYSMPGMSGIDTMKAIAQTASKPKVLIYTAHPTQAVLEEALKAGARGFLAKSDTESHLLAAIAAVRADRPYFSACVTSEMRATFGAGLGPRPELTRRETEIVRLVAEGLSNKEIAWRLTLSVKTVETHRANAMRKVDARSCAELVKFAIRHGMVDAEAA
jgi:DNA-binding NarL/FixJ family response regulator